MQKYNLLKDFSFWSLLFSNAITIFLAIRENWSYETIILVYAMQSLAIGIVTLIRIITLKDFKKTPVYTDSGERIKPVISKKATKIISSILFVLGYLATNSFFFIVFSGIFSVEYEHISWIFFIPGGFFLINHLFSFFYNQERDKEKADIHRIMWFPYIRVAPVFLFITFGGPIFGWLITGSEAGVIIIFIILKTIADLVMHVIEHK